MRLLALAHRLDSVVVERVPVVWLVPLVIIGTMAGMCLWSQIRCGSTASVDGRLFEPDWSGTGGYWDVQAVVGDGPWGRLAP